MSRIIENLKIEKLTSTFLFGNSPLYVQYYITARCNLRCEQCNVIYSNADVSECSHEDSLKVISNLGKIGTQVLLLTGGEPFMRKDLPQMVEAAIGAGIHPRIQTNGYASLDSLKAVVNAGANDISISLDSMKPTLQDRINGGFNDTWKRAMETVFNVTQVFPKNTFAAFGCVLAPSNLDQIINVIKFATEIGWWVSLVPAHSTDINHPRSFSTFDNSMKFPKELFDKLQNVLAEVKNMKSQGYNIYDSTQYLDDVESYVMGKPTRWRERNNGVCDSPGSYFAVLPNGNMAICCDWRFEDNQYSLISEDFPKHYSKKEMYPEAIKIATACTGCMYGSYPEITVTQRFALASMTRLQLFLKEEKTSIKKFETLDDLLEIAHRYE
jgi:MoaA/NifB/PqqE/SkfB family radical SAM enzyme